MVREHLCGRGCMVVWHLKRTILGSVGQDVRNGVRVRVWERAREGMPVGVNVDHEVSHNNWFAKM